MTHAWERAIFPRHILDGDKIKESDFDLDLVEGKVKLSKSVVLKPFETIHISALSESKQHRKRVNVMLERVDGSLGDEIVPANSYSVLYPGSSRAKVALRNLTSREITLKSKTCIAKMAAANVVPHMLAPKIVKNTEAENQTELLIEENGKVRMIPLSEEQQEKLKGKLDLSGIEEWSQEDKRAVDELFRDFG